MFLMRIAILEKKNEQEEGFMSILFRGGVAERLRVWALGPA